MSTNAQTKEYKGYTTKLVNFLYDNCAGLQGPKKWEEFVKEERDKSNNNDQLPLSLFLHAASMLYKAVSLPNRITVEVLYNFGENIRLRTKVTESFQPSEQSSEEDWKKYHAHWRFIGILKEVQRLLCERAKGKDHETFIERKYLIY